MKPIIKTMCLSIMLFHSAWAIAEEVTQEVQYYRLYPDFVTNLAVSNNQAKPQYLQVRVETMTMGEENARLIEHNEPLLRDQLILLFNAQEGSSLRSIKGKKGLQQQALKVMQQVLKNETGSPIIERILFTHMIIE